MASKRKIILTSALPYANGPIHIGHLVEYCIGDFWTRFQKMRGHECLHICADDTHGTPIMISAKEKGISPEELIAESHREHSQDFANFEIEFDRYSSTNTALNRKYVHEFFEKIKQAGLIEQRVLEQAYCEHDAMFLPDRFVKGECPKCGALNQYGDSCDSCSATYSTTDLKGAKCTLCQNPPIARQTEHLFFKLDGFKKFLQAWVPKHTAPEVAKKMAEWLDGDLQDWCISRDKPYFGFEIPGYPDKYFYVWLDAPIGYISSTAEWCEQHGQTLPSWWNEDTEIYHNIGKDIVYFHSLFWPAILKTANYATPNGIFVHGMLTVNGVKMSKSKGTFINAKTYLNHLSPLYLRYYLACKLSGHISDFDLNFEDFASRVNSDLIGKITNVASRGASMLHKLDGQLGSIDPEARSLVEQAQKVGEEIAHQFEQRNFAKGILLIRSIADEANKYFDHHEPWKLVKIDPEKTRQILTTILNMFRSMAIYLKPIIPSYTEKVRQLFGDKDYCWDDALTLLEDQPLNPFNHLMKRLDPKKIEAMVQESKETVKSPEKMQKTKIDHNRAQSSDEVIDFKDFARVKLKIARINAVELVEGADKLYRVICDLGEDQPRTIIAGIKTAYPDPTSLVGRLTVVVANLKPRKMRFGLSQGMILAAGPGGKDIFLLSPDSGANPGDEVS